MTKSLSSVAKPLVPWSRRAIALVAVFTLSGCASMQQNANCALVGAGIGTAGGIIVGATQGSGGADVAAGGAVGLLVGAAVGYGVCALTDLGD